MWLTGRVVPDHNTIVDFRKDNGRAIRQVCFLQAAALRVLANDTDKMVALLKGTTGRDAGVSQRPKTSLLSRGGGNAAQRRRAIAHRRLSLAPVTRWSDRSVRANKFRRQCPRRRYPSSAATVGSWIYRRARCAMRNRL